ncbi:hypothetical protein NKG05_07265 [Oerskovia sp. M15]
MVDDPRYLALVAAGVEVASLGRRPDRVTGRADHAAFTEGELAIAAQHAARADIVLSLKEQPCDSSTSRTTPRSR